MRSMSIYFTNIGNETGRTIDTKVFFKLKDATRHNQCRLGYIIRGEGDKRTLVKFTGGFMPSANESRLIEQMTGLTWEQIGQKARKDNLKKRIK